MILDVALWVVKVAGEPDVARTRSAQSVSEEKGGAGKTPVTINLAGTLVSSGKRVLVCDRDGKVALTTSVGFDSDVQKDNGHSICSLVTEIEGVSGKSSGRSSEAARRAGWHHRAYLWLERRRIHLRAEYLSVGGGAGQGGGIDLLLRSTFLTPVSQLFESIIASWAENNGVPVNFSWGTFEVLNDTLVTASSTGAGPDVIQMVNTRPHQFAEALMDVSESVEAFGESEGAWYSVARDICEVDGVWRSVPHFFTPIALVYREDMFADVGWDHFPETWDELLEAGRALKAAGNPIGLALGRAPGDGSNWTYSMLWSFGGAVTDETGMNVTLDSAETRDALNYAKTLYEEAMDPNAVAWDDGTNNRAMLGGEVAMTNNSASILFAARNDGLEIQDVLNHAKYPSGPAGLFQPIELTSTGIMNCAGNVEASLALANHFNDAEVWLPLARDGFAFFIPAFEGFEDSPAMPWNTDPKLAAFKDIAADGVHFGYPGPPTSQGNEVFVNFTINDMFAQAASGAASVDDAVAQAVEAVNEIYNR